MARATLLHRRTSRNTALTPRLALVFLAAIMVPVSGVSAQNRAGQGRPGGRFQMPDPVMEVLDAEERATSTGIERATLGT